MNDKVKRKFIATRCCNPFSEEYHKVNVKHLRNVSSWMLDLQNVNIELGMKICDTCRKKLLQNREVCDGREKEIMVTADADPDFEDTDSCIDFMNKSLSYINQSPIDKKKASYSAAYVELKLEKVKASITSKLEPNQISKEQVYPLNDQSEWLDQLKEKFARTTSRSEKLTILSVLPKSWTSSKIMAEFESASSYMVRQTKKMVSSKGIMCSPDPKPGRTLANETVLLVKDFYSDDDISRLMPGKSDTVSVKEGSSRTHVQKRLILANLSELYQIFKTKHPGKKIGFSKFCELRPKNCILAGSNGTHTVCVCLTHQNIKLMMVGAHFEKIQFDDWCFLKTSSAVLSMVMCNPSRTECHTNDCAECPGTNTLRKVLISHFEDSFVENVTYKQWVTVDRCTMETMVKDVEEFVDEFCDMLLKLKTHDFIARMQKSFYNKLKATLKEDEVLVTCDFAENYSFVSQDEVQLHHWSRAQATVHPFIIYFRTDEVIQNINVVFISECLIHNTVAFYTFVKKLIPLLKSKRRHLRKIFYFSDGSAAQYKNCKNFLNLCNHKEDFHLDAEWHFFASAHGKSACDGLGGTVKRLAARASLQRPYNDQILTPTEFFQYAKQNILGIHFEYTTFADYKESETGLSSRFHDAKQIVGTQKFHSFIPTSNSELEAKFCSCDIPGNKAERHSVSKRAFIQESFQVPKISSGYATIEYDGKWWVACILATHKDETTLKVTLLHPRGPSSSYTFPAVPDIQNIPTSSVLMQVEPCTSTGRTYTISMVDSQKSSHLLARRYKL